MKRIPAFLLCTTFITTLATVPVWAQATAPQPQNQTATAAPSSNTQTAAAAPAKTEKKIKYYNYANDESEYSVLLPEAPAVRTILPNSPLVKLYTQGNLPEDTSFMGESARFMRTNINTEQMFDAQIFFIKTSKSFLDSLTEQEIEHILKESYKGTQLIEEKFHYSASSGKGALKWATMTAFTMDAHNQPAFVVTHYLTGMSSVFIVKVQFSVRDKLYNEYYKKLLGSITYSPP